MKETYRVFESKTTIGLDEGTARGSGMDLHGAFVEVFVAGVVDQLAGAA